MPGYVSLLVRVADRALLFRPEVTRDDDADADGVGDGDDDE